MEHKPKIMLFSGLVICLLLLLSGSEFTKKYFINNRIDLMDSNILANRYYNDFSYYKKTEPQLRINDMYIDNNSKLIDNRYITPELKSIPKPIIVQNYYATDTNDQ